MEKARLLYVYEERIPEDLRALVLGLIPKDRFAIDTMTYRSPEGEQAAKLARADVVLFAPGRFLPDDILEHARRVKLMQLWSSGYDKFNVAGATKLGIPVANNGGANAIAVAEHTILLMLAVAKRLPEHHLRTVTGKWAGNRHGMDMFLLHGKTVAILGFGRIGRLVARRVRAFEAHVIYYDVVRLDEQTEQEAGLTFKEFDTLVGSADILTLHLHATPQTEGIIGARELEMMKAGAVLINVSRAQLVDHDALYIALAQGRLSGAGLDVYPQEPTQPNDRLLQLPNVVATPHMAGSTREAYEIAIRNAVDNFTRVLQGDTPLWVVNGVGPI